MIFIRGPISFYGMRFLLGAAEAGFLPGMILYMKRWFPANARARAVAWFMTANPLAGIVGSPDLGGVARYSAAKDFPGWQWMFLMEGVPAILLGAACFGPLGYPARSKVVEERRARWLLESLALEQQAEAGVPLRKRICGRFLSARESGCSPSSILGFPPPCTALTLWLPSVIQSLVGSQLLRDRDRRRHFHSLYHRRNGTGRNAF